MKNLLSLLFDLLKIGFVIVLFLSSACSDSKPQIDRDNAYHIIFLHHSTGNVIWKGKPSGTDVIKNFFSDVHAVPEWFDTYNASQEKAYLIEERSFPKAEPYGWNNYPFDYYNIWVKNGGEDFFNEEPTLENLTNDYQMIIFKHCFPVSLIKKDSGEPDIGSDEKRVENYKVQYIALREKMHQFSETKFLVWTSAAMVESKTNPEQARLAREFVDWVKSKWDEPDDNIYLWDFYELETEGGLYLTNENARSEWDSHPSKEFAARVAPLFCNRIIDVAENKGKSTTLTGEKKSN
ncbi:MAG: hypothetical protein KDC05_13180 [Bacteroidales bacterium]|nr:hypothetical protein [Bacteroidales bacterium]